MLLSSGLTSSAPEDLGSGALGAVGCIVSDRHRPQFVFVPVRHAPGGEDSGSPIGRPPVRLAPESWNEPELNESGYLYMSVCQRSVLKLCVLNTTSLNIVHPSPHLLGLGGPCRRSDCDFVRSVVVLFDSKGIWLTR